jgi:thiamine biosynthesis lipoprotein
MNSSPPLSNTSRASTAAVAVLAGLLAAACAEDRQWVEERRFAMGTWVDTIYQPPDEPTRQRIESALDTLLHRYEVDYYAWADGELGRLNAALSRGDSFVASAELHDLLERSRELSLASGGLFDPGVGALVEAWGFNSADNTPGEPEAAFLEQWRTAQPSIVDLLIDDRVLSTTQRDLVIDLGGIAKGEVIDRILDRFAAAGIDDVLINAGGDVRVLGTRGERSWTIGIQSPRAQTLLGSIMLESAEAAFTSGDYERFYEADGARRHHLLNPKTGLPATHTQAVTVIARNGALADAAATAIFIAGPRRWREVAADLGIALVLRVDAEGDVEMTPAMRERVRMQAGGEPVTIPLNP